MVKFHLLAIFKIAKVKVKTSVIFVDSVERNERSRHPQMSSRPHPQMRTPLRSTDTDDNQIVSRIFVVKHRINTEFF